MVQEGEVPGHDQHQGVGLQRRREVVLEEVRNHRASPEAVVRPSVACLP